jgi:hypothetical protein
VLWVLPACCYVIVRAAPIVFLVLLQRPLSAVAVQRLAPAGASVAAMSAQQVVELFAAYNGAHNEQRDACKHARRVRLLTRRPALTLVLLRSVSLLPDACSDPCSEQRRLRVAALTTAAAAAGLLGRAVLPHLHEAAHALRGAHAHTAHLARHARPTRRAAVVPSVSPRRILFQNPVSRVCACRCCRSRRPCTRAAELGDASVFAAFYRFAFFVAREPAQRNLTVDTALIIWPLVLSGRFRLLDKWCAFVAGARRLGITEDTWRQVSTRFAAVAAAAGTLHVHAASIVPWNGPTETCAAVLACCGVARGQVLDFSRLVHEDMSNYDPHVRPGAVYTRAAVAARRVTGHLSQSCADTLLCHSSSAGRLAGAGR